MSNIRILALLLVVFMISITINVVYANPPVETLRPNEDIYTYGWSVGGTGTCHYDRINEVVADGDTSYLYSVGGVPFYYDLFGLTDIPSGYIINSVKVWVVARAWFGSPQNVRILIKTHDTFYPALDFYDEYNYSGTHIGLTGSYKAYSRTWLNNPYTNSPWTTSEVNDLQAAIQNSYGNDEPTVTQLYVEVDIIPQFVVSELPIGTMAALASAIVAFAAVAFCKHSRPKW